MTDRQLGSARKRIDHLIVLMLENRSFDHMFGYLNHPSPVYERLEEGDRRFPNPDDNTDPAGPPRPEQCITPRPPAGR